MSDGTKVNDTPTPDVVVLVWGGRCQQCGLTYPGDGEDPVIRAHVKSEWVKAGLGHLVQDEWPRRFPAWLGGSLGHVVRWKTSSAGVA